MLARIDDSSTSGSEGEIGQRQQVESLDAAEDPIDLVRKLAERHSTFFQVAEDRNVNADDFGELEPGEPEMTARRQNDSPGHRMGCPRVLEPKRETLADRGGIAVKPGGHAANHSISRSVSKRWSDAITAATLAF